MEVTTEQIPKENSDSPLPANNISEKAPTPQPQEQPKKSKKDDRSKKDDKNVEQFMKSLNSVPTLDEKLSLVCKKYVQTADDNKKMQFYIKQSDKRYALLVKEKEQLQHEFNKTVLVKSKLENLCRELQKQNKAIKEESLLKIREEEERRKETQAKFQNTLTEITSLLQQNNEKNAKLRDDNISMTEKFKSVVQQYQLREQQVDKMAKQMALESQLSDAKLQKASLEHQAEKEKILSEMEQLKVTLAQYRAKIMELQGTETALKGQLAVYTDKYDEFQNALVKSSQVFGGFKEQMEKMSKKIQKLEKESLTWKKKWETSQSALLEMCGERQAGEERAALAARHLAHMQGLCRTLQVRGGEGSGGHTRDVRQAGEERAALAARHLAHMQGLCRTLQGERTVLLSTLKEHNIERPPLPTPPPSPALPPAPTPASNAKVDAMAANCVQLRQSLAHLQSQLNVLTNKKEESPKPEKQKKKSKKNKGDKQKANQEVAKENNNNKESPEDNQSNVEEIKLNETESPEEKVDTKTMENLIQAINMANINLCDLEIVNEQQNDNVETDQAVLVEEIVEPIAPTVEPIEPTLEPVDSKVEPVESKLEPVNPKVADNTESVLDKAILDESAIESVQVVDSKDSKSNLESNESNKVES